MNFFKNLFAPKTPTEPFHFGSLVADMHSHLLPGIDDGSSDMDQTIGMILKMKELGYKKLVFTPHVMMHYYPNEPEIILQKLEAVKAECQKLGIEIELLAAAEYYFDETFFERVKSKSLLTFGDNYVLFEFPFTNMPLQVETLFFELRNQNYRPVLAHFERYLYYFDKPEIAREYRDRGVNIQVNLLSLVGHYGPQVAKQAKYLVDHQLVDFVGTDCHRIEHLQILERNATNPYFAKLRELRLLNQSF
jgi:protein-tyrosine phosphatase